MSRTPAAVADFGRMVASLSILLVAVGFVVAAAPFGFAHDVLLRVAMAVRDFAVAERRRAKGGAR